MILTRPKMSYQQEKTKTFEIGSIVYHTGALIANIGREKTVKTGIRSQAMRGFRSDHDPVRSSPEITRRSAIGGVLPGAAFAIHHRLSRKKRFLDWSKSLDDLKNTRC